MKAVRIRSTIGSLVILWLLGAGIGRAEETNHIKSLTVEEATRLAQHEGWLSLNGLTTISDDVAAAFGQHKRALHLDGLTKLSAAAAASLASHRGELSLNGLTARD